MTEERNIVAFEFHWVNKIGQEETLEAQEVLLLIVNFLDAVTRSRFFSGCGKRNHFVEKCSMQQSLGKRDTFSKAKIHAVQEETTSSDDEILTVEISPQSNLEINAVTQSPQKNKIFASMLIKGRQISFQLDSGATCNVLPDHFVPPGTKVEKSDYSLRMYSKALLPITGICKLKVVNPKIQAQYTVRFIIVKGDYVPLLGANAAQKMGLLTVDMRIFLMLM